MISTSARSGGVHEGYRFVNQPRGSWEREYIGFSGVIEDPSDRFCHAPIRRQNVIFNYAEALWYLSGKNDLDFISYFAPRMARYSSDGKTLPGTGYGPKLLRFGSDGLNQIARAVDVLTQDDPDSKRVVLQIFDAREDIRKSNIDVSCTIGLQLLLRDGRLHMVAYMRANDAYVGMLSDVFSFTFIQEFIAGLIGSEIGTYTHFVGSIHIYENDFEAVERLLNSDHFDYIEPANRRMPKEVSFGDILAVLSYEGEVRKGNMTGKEIESLEIDEYWRQILLLFLAHAHLRRRDVVPKPVFALIDPAFRRMLAVRWPTLTPSLMS